MEYRELTERDVNLITRIFSIPEYELYFAENDTTEEQWKVRLTLFETSYSYVISKNGIDVGWIMYSLDHNICNLDIVVLLPSERGKGYGKEIFTDLHMRHPTIKAIKLDVQQQNKYAVSFYKNMGFEIIGEEYQSVGDEKMLYYKMVLNK